MLASSACSQRVVNGPIASSAPPARPLKSAISVAIERQARNAVDAGDGDYQIKVLRQRLASHPDDLSARLDLANRYKKSGYPDVALEHYRLAVERFPNSEEASIALARSLRAASLPNEAASILDRLRSRQPASATPRLFSAISERGASRMALRNSAAASSSLP